MADQAGRVGSRRVTERRRKTTKTAKPLGKAAMRAMLANEEIVESFIERLTRGDVPDLARMGRVTAVLGGGRFNVTLLGAPGHYAEEEMSRPVGLAGILQGSRKMAANPAAETAVHRGSYVLVQRILMGAFNRGKVAEIIAVFSEPEQRLVRGLLRIASEKATSEREGGFEFNYEEADEKAEEERAALHEKFRRELTGAAAAGGGGSSNRSSAGASSGTRLSAAPNWEELEEEEKTTRRAAKMTRKKERRQAKKAGGSA
jgi:hypothetical protein